MNDHNIDPARRTELFRKYQMGDPPQANNPVVAAIERADQMYGRLFVRDSSGLFDPERSPDVYAVAQRALADLHAAMGEPPDSVDPEGLGRLVLGPEHEAPPRVHCHHQDEPDDEFTPLSPDDPALYVHFVGSSDVFVVRGNKQVGAFDLATRGPGRPRRGVDYFTGMFRLMMELRPASPVWDIDCNLNVSRGCGGPTELLPYRAGAFLLVFEVCEACMTYAEAAAETGHQLSVMEAYARAGLPFP
ncbi:hypothetical protein PUR22_07630 [Mycolicibacterium porcinum]|uniref:hypothetical protein n=1 Tax=Mycolicibacterium porcinum TaxID=39693 RepID=UPI0031F9DE28